MDAAKTHTLRKTALLLTIALLLAAPFAAQAQTAFAFPTGAAITINGTSYGCTTVSSNVSGSPITFGASQVRVAGDPILDIQPGTAGLTTDVSLCVAASNLGGVTASSRTITVNLTSTSPAGITAPITVTWNAAGSGGGSGGSGSTGSGLTISYPSGSNISMSSNNGVLVTGSFSLNNTTSGSIAYSIGTTAYDSTGTGWLNFLSATQGTIAGGQSMQMVVTGNPSGLTNGTHTASFTITYQGAGSGTISNVPVSFAVNGSSGGGNGTLAANPNPVSWSYSSSNSNPLSAQIPNTSVVISTSVGATSYGFTVQSSGSNGYLLLASSQISGSGISFSTPLILTPTSNIQALPTGTYQELINLTDSANNTAVLTVNITVNGSNGGNGITLSPAPLQLNASVGQTSLVQGTVTLTSTTSGTVVLNVSGTGLTLANNSTQQSINVTGGQSTSFIVYANPTGLVQNTYNGTLSAVEGSLSQSIQVAFSVGQNSGGGGSTTNVAPTSLQFFYQIGQPTSGASTSLIPQNITAPFTGSFTTAVTSGGAWLSVSPTSGSGPTSITVSAGNVSGMPTGTYTGAFTVTPASTGVAQTVSVTLQISSSAVIFSNPPVLNISYIGGSANPAPTFTVIASDSSALAVSASSSQSWVTVAALGSTTPASFALTVNASTLPNGVNVANVSVGSNGANQLTVPVVVTVTGSSGGNTGALTIGSSSLTFTAAVNGGAPSSQTLTISASSATSYTASASVSNGTTNWLSISPSGSLNTGTTSALTVSVNPAGLGAATYQGTISLSTSSGTQTVPVTFVVGSSGGSGGNITLNPSSLPAFNYTSGGTVPASQSFNVLATNGNGTSISYTVAATTQSGGSWLLATPASGVTGQAVTVGLDSSVLGGLAAGTYSGTVTVTPSGGTAVSVPTTLVVQGLPTVSASPSTLTLTYQAGSTTTPTGTVQVSGSVANLSFTANASSAGWLQVSPTTGSTGTTGATLQVTTTPTGLAAGSYTGTIVVAGTNGATGSSTTTVTLTVTAPLPTISAVLNAASGANGPVSPGEIVSIFGPASNPIGPSTPASLTLDSNGNVSTTLGGVQVLFNGIPAPLTYVSATQINAVVPYQIAGQFAPFAQVKFLNQSSNAFSLNTASTAPGIFTQNGSGTGPGAILNQDFSTNGTSSVTKPAAKGSVIAIYMTGEGATSPAGVTGKVTCSNCAISQLPVPLLPVTVTFIDSNNVRYPANFSYAGEAPGFVSGLMQINATVPSNVPSGTLQVVVSVGSNSSQSGVTVAIQ